MQMLQRQKTSLKKYIAIGVVANWAFSVLLGWVSRLFIGSDLANFATFAAVTLACFMVSFIAGDFFFWDHRRAATIAESRRYSFYTVLWGGILPMLLIIGALYLLFQFDESAVAMSTEVLAFPGAIGTLVIAILVFILAVFMGVQYLILRWTFTWYTRRQSHKRSAKQAAKPSRSANTKR